MYGLLLDRSSKLLISTGKHLSIIHILNYTDLSMRKSYHRKKPKSNIKDFRVNEKIFAPELMVIDENGAQLGLIKKAQALIMARERELDLVEVSPKAQPPIAKFMDYGSFKYRRAKMERKAKAKQKTSEIKTVKISSRISQHDMEVRINQAVKFLTDGDKVKIELQLKGREHQHANLGEDNIKKIIEAIKAKLENQELKTEQAVTRQGSKISAIVAVN